MNILIIGSGAREHILTKAFARSAIANQRFCCGSSINPGIKALTTDYALTDLNDPDAVTRQALAWQIDLAIIGPEAPLERGLADKLTSNGIKAVGPKQQSARLETSKGFARDLLAQYGIQGSPRYQSFQDLTGVRAFLEALGEGQYVVKADGLMSGKGVKVAGCHLHSIDEAMQFCETLHAQGMPFVIEEKLIGQEFSLLNFCDGNRLIPMPLVQDHKRAFVGDKGPNTGGMGSYSDANHRLPFVTAADIETAQAINQAVMTALQSECEETYQGILYGSFIATAKGVSLIEYNTRFGDPEALNLLSILDSDFLAICLGMVQGILSEDMVRFKPLATVCKYAVPLGYPDEPVRNQAFHIEAVLDKDRLYYAGVNEQDGVLYATGARAVAVIGIAPTLKAAEQIAEAEINRIEGRLFHREDIGKEALIQSRIQMMQQLRSETVLC